MPVTKQENLNCAQRYAQLESKAALPAGYCIGLEPGEYSRYSRWVTDIIASKAPLFEKASIDEFYIDLTGMDKFFNALQWTVDLRKEIIDATKLPISFGLASNKMMAKIARMKPSLMATCKFRLVRKRIFSSHACKQNSGVGEHTHEALKAMGITLIKHISERSVEELEERLGKVGS